MFSSGAGLLSIGSSVWSASAAALLSFWLIIVTRNTSTSKLYIGGYLLHDNGAVSHDVRYAWHSNVA